MTSVGENMKKLDPCTHFFFFTFGTNVKQCATMERSNVELPCNLTAATLSLYLKEYIAALFTIAKRWQEPKCPSTENQSMSCTYNGLFGLKQK